MHRAKLPLIEARDAESGIEIARDEKPDLILMDIHLPGMDGLTATRIIKRDPRLGHIPVVALSGDDSPNERRQAQEAGCCAFISKPINVKTFTADIQNFLVQD